jgi:hypothetical protein
VDPAAFPELHSESQQGTPGPTAPGGVTQGAVAMESARTRYELRVATLVSSAALATFRVAVRPTAVPRNTVYSFRVPADRDLSEVLDRLTERQIQVLEIRRCPEPRRRRATAPSRQEAAREEAARQDAEDVAGVVLPFRGATAAPPGEPGRDPGGTAQPDDPLRRRPPSFGADDAGPPRRLHAAERTPPRPRPPSPQREAARNRGRT